MLLARGVTFWVPAHAPQSLPWGCIYLSLVSCTWFSPGHGPLMGRICPRVSQQWRGYFTSQVYPLLVLELMALKPPFFVTVLSYQGPRLPHGVAPSTVFPTYGHRGVTPSISSLGYVFSWRRLVLAFGDCSSWAMPLLGDASLERCLSWAMPLSGDASLGRCLSRAMPLSGDASLGRCLTWVPRGVLPHIGFDFWSTPGDGTVHKPPVLS